MRQTIPFFTVKHQGTIYFGNWYHRRDFGTINVLLRAITQSTEQQRKILPQHTAFSEHPHHYLDRQLDALRKTVYHDVHSHTTQIHNLTATAAPTRDQSAQGNGGFRGLLLNLLDPRHTSDAPAATHSKTDASQLKARLHKTKLAAQHAFDKRKRTYTVSAALTRYTYQAVYSTYSSVATFTNVLANLLEHLLQYLKLTGGRTTA